MQNCGKYLYKYSLNLRQLNGRVQGLRVVTHSTKGNVEAISLKAYSHEFRYKSSVKWCAQSCHTPINIKFYGIFYFPRLVCVYHIGLHLGIAIGQCERALKNDAAV